MRNNSAYLALALDMIFVVIRFGLCDLCGFVRGIKNEIYKWYFISVDYRFRKCISIRFDY